MAVAVWIKREFTSSVYIGTDVFSSLFLRGKMFVFVDTQGQALPLLCCKYCCEAPERDQHRQIRWQRSTERTIKSQQISFFLYCCFFQLSLAFIDIITIGRQCVVYTFSSNKCRKRNTILSVNRFSLTLCQASNCCLTIEVYYDNNWRKKKHYFEFSHIVHGIDIMLTDTKKMGSLLIQRRKKA